MVNYCKRACKSTNKTILALICCLICVEPNTTISGTGSDHQQSNQTIYIYLSLYISCSFFFRSIL